MSDLKQSDEWLIVKRDLYWAPDGMGYTGIRDEAGRYTHEAALSHMTDGVSIVHISEAPEFRKAAYKDLVTKHLQKPGVKVGSLIEWLYHSDALVVNGQISLLGFMLHDYKGDPDNVVFRLQNMDHDHSFTEAALEEAYIDEFGALAVEDTAGKTCLLKPVQMTQKKHPHADAWPRPEARGMKP